VAIAHKAAVQEHPSEPGDVAWHQRQPARGEGVPVRVEGKHTRRIGADRIQDLLGQQRCQVAPGRRLEDPGQDVGVGRAVAEGRGGRVGGPGSGEVGTPRLRQGVALQVVPTGAHVEQVPHGRRGVAAPGQLRHVDRGRSLGVDLTALDQDAGQRTDDGLGHRPERV